MFFVRCLEERELFCMKTTSLWSCWLLFVLRCNTVNSFFFFSGRLSVWAWFWRIARKTNAFCTAARWCWRRCARTAAPCFMPPRSYGEIRWGGPDGGWFEQLGGGFTVPLIESWFCWKMGVSPIWVSFHLCWFSTEPWLWERVQALWPLGWLACVVLRPSGCIRALPSPPSNRRRKRRHTFWEGCRVATKAGMVLWPYENPMLPISGWWVSSELLDSLRE